MPYSLKGWRIACLLGAASIMLTGCWDKLELNKWAFVQAVAVDLARDGQIRLTHQIYKPGSTENMSMAPSSGATFFNVTSENSTVYGASLETSNEIGRKLQWSHMESMIISEQFARERNIGEVLDFFSRSHEPKSTLAIVIAKGEAQSHLNGKPLIESSIGEQLASSIATAQMQSSSSLVVSLTDLSVLAKQPDAIFIIPYLHAIGDKTDPRAPTFALFRFPEGKLSNIVPSAKAPYLLMLMNRYRRGLVNVPCQAPDSGHMQEAFRISALQTKIKPKRQGDQLTVKVDVQATGHVKELTCSNIQTEDDVERFTGMIAEKLREQLASTIDYLQQQKADVIGVGNYMHRWHNGLWKTWKSDWGDRFKNSKFEITVRVRLTHTGIDTGQPFTTNKQ